MSEETVPKNPFLLSMLKIVEVRNLSVQDGEQILFWEQ